MAPKDRDHIRMKSGIIYRFKCHRVDCDGEYIGESSRTFGERFTEHLKAPTPICDHQNITGHDTTIENFSIVGREDQNLIRAIKEAIYIRVNNPSLNRDIGKYHLPHIWDEVLINIPELTFGERFKEHLKAPTPIYDHQNITGHDTTIENFRIVGREDQNLIRAIKEAIYIRVNNPSLNRDIGKYHLPHIWDEVLLNIPELTFW